MTVFQEIIDDTIINDHTIGDCVAFINRKTELGRIAELVAAATRGRPERHLAFVGVRRIGKSRLIEHYRDNDPPLAVAYVRMDAATVTLPVFMRAMVRAVVNGLARHRPGLTPVGKNAGDSEVVALAAAVDARIVPHVLNAHAAAEARKPDGQRLLEIGLSFPEVVAEALDEPVIVVADEFQHILGLSEYAPFGGRARGTPRRTTEDAQEALLATVRATIERPNHVGWVVTGSSVRMLQHVFAQGPLMGRFDVIPVLPFDEEDSLALAEAVWDEMGAEALTNAAARAFRLTQGHPFYLDVACREAAAVARQLEREVSPSMVDAAFALSIHRPEGQIDIACAEMYQALTDRHRSPVVRGFLDALATGEPASVPEIAQRMGGVAAATVYRAADELVLLGLVERTEEGTNEYVFRDPVFRYWVARAKDPEMRPPREFDPEALRRLTRTFAEAYLRERNFHGPLSEGFLRDLCRAFHGQQIEGKRLGRPGVHVRLPMSTTVRTAEAYDHAGETTDDGRPAPVELDLCFGDDAVWLGEVKRKANRATGADIDKLVRKAAFLRKALSLPDGPLWFVSFYGFEPSAVEAARKQSVYYSDLADLKSIRAAVGTARPADG